MPARPASATPPTPTEPTRCSPPWLRPAPSSASTSPRGPPRLRLRHHRPSPTRTPRRPPKPCPDDPVELADLVTVRPNKMKANVSILIDGIALKRGYATANET